MPVNAFQASTSRNTCIADVFIASCSEGECTLQNQGVRLKKRALGRMYYKIWVVLCGLGRIWGSEAWF